MDKFTKNALIACVALSALIIVFFYAGITLGHADLSGSDDKVNENAANAGNKIPTQLIALDQNGEYVGFTILSIIGGFTAGYIWVIIFDEESNKGVEAHG